jgi:hypothetical protein
VSSNLTRSTKRFQTLTVPRQPRTLSPEPNWSPNLVLLMGTLGRPVNSVAAHEWLFIFNAIRRMGSVGTVFHTCCLLETTTFRFLYRRVPIAARSPEGVV